MKLTGLFHHMVSGFMSPPERLSSLGGNPPTDACQEEVGVPEAQGPSERRPILCSLLQSL